jgi:hypothetical protein
MKAKRRNGSGERRALFAQAHRGRGERVMGIDEGDLMRPDRREAVHRSRELISCIARRHSDVGLGELVRYLCEGWFKSTRPD